MKITWIGQSGYRISTEQTTVYIDPYLSDVVNRVANRPRLVKAPIRPDKKFTGQLDNGFEMEYCREYELMEILSW